MKLYLLTGRIKMPIRYLQGNILLDVFLEIYGDLIRVLIRHGKSGGKGGNQ